MPAVLVQLEEMWDRDLTEPDLDQLKVREMLKRCYTSHYRDMWSVSVSAWGTILVTGLLPRNTVSKQELGGRKVFMMAVVDMSGDKAELFGVRLELLVLLLVLTLLVASGGRQEKVALILAVLSWLDMSMKSSESASLMV